MRAMTPVRWPRGYVKKGQRTDLLQVNRCPPGLATDDTNSFTTDSSGYWPTAKLNLITLEDTTKVRSLTIVASYMQTLSYSSVSWKVTWHPGTTQDGPLHNSSQCPAWVARLLPWKLAAARYHLTESISRSTTCSVQQTPHQLVWSSF